MYRAMRFVQKGVADEHAYNMFLSFEEICCRIGLWDQSVGWLPLNMAFKRLTKGMYPSVHHKRVYGGAQRFVRSSGTP